MIFVFGGIYQGKLDYVKENYEVTQIIDCKNLEPQSFSEGTVLSNFEYFINTMLEKDIDPVKYIKDNINKFKEIIIIGNEIGLGVVPMKKEDRILRDNVGFIYQILSKEAKSVVRVWNGLPMRIK